MLCKIENANFIIAVTVLNKGLRLQSELQHHSFNFRTSKQPQLRLHWPHLNVILLNLKDRDPTENIIVTTIQNSDFW